MMLAISRIFNNLWRLTRFIIRFPQIEIYVIKILTFIIEQLIQLIEQAKLLHEQRQAEIERNKTRLISAGGGKKSQLALEEQIILTLIYLLHHLSFQILGLLFHVSESTANNIFNYWQSLLLQSLPASLLEQVKKCEEDEEAILEVFADYELIVDSADQEK